MSEKDKHVECIYIIIELSWVLLLCLTGVLPIVFTVSNDPVISFRNLVGYCFQTKHNSTFAQLKTGSTKKIRFTVSGIGVEINIIE